MNRTPIRLDPKCLQDHSSAYLHWQWRFQDFYVRGAEILDSRTGFVVTFKPKYRLLLRLLNWLGKRPKLSVLATHRLANIAGIISAGIFLGKEKKDGEVLVKEIHTNFHRPVFYNHNSIIKVTVEIADHVETDAWDTYWINFEVGEHADHTGSIKCFYRKPNQTR